MKSEYLKNLIIYKDHSKLAYESYLERIQELFLKVQNQPTVTNFAKFQTQIHAIKYHRELKPKHKQPIFKYFVQRNVHDFHFLREHNSLELRLLKATKTQLDDYQLDWRQVWQRLLDKQPELPSVKNYNELTDFLRIIRHLYSPENPVDVINYFMERHSLYTDNLSSYLTLFINLTQKTSSSTFSAYLQKLFELYNLNQLKASDLLVMYLNASKFKQNEISPKIHQQLNKIVLYSLSTPSSDKKDSIESKFSTQTSNIVFRIIGKCNKCSVQLIEQIFKMLKLFIRPFEDSKKPLKFLCLFIMGFSKRLDTQNGYREKLVKLKAKLEKSQKKLLKKQQPLSPESPQVIPTVQQPETALQKPITAKQIYEKSQQQQKEEDSEDQQQQQNDSQEQDQDNKVEKLITMQLQLEQQVPEKHTSLQNRIDKLQLLLQNQITEQIKKVVESFIVKHLEEVFYVNSKKMVSRILKETFKLYPHTVTKSLDILEKAGNIPTINEDGLISNIKFIAKYIFSENLIEKGVFLEYMLKLLGRVKQSRRITDVWDILSSFILKIPLLDQKDMQSISDTDKEAFQKKFNQNHDRFYENYSEDIFDCIKRLFSESQYYDESTSHSIDKHILDLLSNSHPHYKKRVLHEMEEQILENNNKFLLSIFHPGLRPSKSFEASLHEMIENGNIQNQENMSLNISVNIILSIDMNIEQIKKLIRKYSKKNNYKFLKQIMVSLTNYIITFQPLSSTLDYLQKKPQIKMKQEPSHQLVQNKILHVYEYSMEIIDQLVEQLKQFEDQPLKKMSYEQIVTQMYKKKNSDFKNMKVEKRKTINELLQILKIIVEHLFHEFEQYNPQTSTLDFKPAPYKRESLVTNQKFISIVHTLTFNQIFLHDPNIMSNLTGLIENEIYFQYRHYIRLEKQIMKKYIKKNQREELPGQSNLLYVANMEIGKSRIAHFLILYNKYKDSVNIEPIREPLNMLLIAPGNESSNVINKIIVKKSESIEKDADRLIFLLGRNFDSRFFYEKVFSLFGDFLTSGYKFSPEQIVSIINHHLPLFQSEIIKVKEQSFRSLDRFFKTMRKSDLFGQVQHKLREFTKRQKLELIWMIVVIIISKEGRRQTDADEYLGQLFEYLQEMQKLVLSDIRIVRRLAVFAYSFMLRRARQALKAFERVECESIKYSNPKTITQIYESGFLREEHIENKQIANYEMLRKTAPYSSFRRKKYATSQIYTKIQDHAFKFVLQNPQIGLKILKQFHIDMAASVEQVISMMHNKKHDLSEIAVRNLQGCYVYAKLQKLHFDRFEHHFGESFFKFLLYKDAEKNEMKFFKATKDEVENLLGNIEGYDNQTLIFIYLADVLATYEHYHLGFSQDLRREIQNFVIKFITEIIYKGSGSIFKQLMVLVSHCKEKKAFTFIQSFLENLINNKEKVSRASQLLFTLCEDDYKVYNQTAKKILSQRLQINNAYINTLLNTVITLPEKYMLTRPQIQKYGIINLEKEKEAQNLQQLYHHEIYLPSNKELDQFIVDCIEKYVEIIAKQAHGQQETKQKNELIKATYGITTNLISTFCQFYQTPESVTTILKLLQLLFRLLSCKMDLPIDYKTLEDTIKTLLSNKHDHISNFQQSLDLILKHLSSLPVKKQADIIKIVANRPGNFHFVSQEYYQGFIFKALNLEEHSMIYKDLLISLSTLLSYVPLPLAVIQRISDKVSKGQGILLLQAYVMSTEDIASPFISRILNTSTRQRRNLFCKEMLQLRGKKEYLDDEERYVQWREIKQYSNPYHYHA